MTESINLLLIEDNAEDARLIRELLSRDGSNFTVSEANCLANAREAIARAKPDLILLDLSLPDAEGLTALKEIQQAQHAVPIVVVGQLGDESLAVRALQEGAQDYLVKGRIDGHLLARSMRYAIQRKLAEEKLRGALAESQRRRTRVAALLKSAREVLRSQNLGDAVRTVFAGCKAAIGASAGLVVLRAPDGAIAEPLFADAGDLGEGVDLVDIMVTSGLAARVAETGDATFENGLLRPAGKANEETVGNVLCVPLTFVRGMVGFLCLANKPPGFDSEDANLAYGFAEIIAMALYHQRNLEALAESERKYRALFNNANDAVFLHDLREGPAGRFLDVNDVATQMFAYTREEFLNMSILDAIVVGPETPGLAAEILASGNLTFEVLATTKDGRLFPAEVSSHVFPLHDTQVVLSIARDISQRKQAEADLRRSEEHFRALFEASPVGIYRTTPEGRILVANPAFVRMLGYDSFEELAQLNLERDRVYAGQPARETVKEMIARDGEIRGLEAEWYRRDGSIILVRLTARAILGPDGSVEAYEGTVEDVTAERETKEALEDSIRRERLALRSLPMAQYSIMQVDDRLGVVWMSDQIKDITGFKPARFARNREFWSTRIHPEDRERVLAQVERLGESEDYLETEYRWRCADGGYRWFLDQAVMARDARGKPKEIVGNWLDITDRKRTEEDLREGVERLRRMLEGTIRAMALTVETRDPYTAGHQRRVAELAEAIAKRMSLSEEQVTIVKLAATVHDIGKIGVPAEILSRPGRINALEFRLIRSHPQVGYDILRTIEFPWPIADVVLQHHERLDGSGYPKGITGDGMMQEARVLAVADVVEAMASHRPYRPALGVDEALAEISRQSGILYDPAVVAACRMVLSGTDFIWS